MRVTRRTWLAAAAAAFLAAAPACAGPGTARAPARRLDEGAARETLRAFARAVRGGRWDDAAPLLSARWRAAYTPGRLALDFRGAGAVGADAAARVLAALDAGTPLVPAASALRLPTGGGGAASVVAEDGAWRVDALE